MAELTTLARPYARAAFEQARSSSSLGEWSKSLLLLAQLSQETKVQTLLSSPSHTAEMLSFVVQAKGHCQCHICNLMQTHIAGES